MSRLRMKIILFTTHKSYRSMLELFSNLTNWVTVIDLNDYSYDFEKINTNNYNKILKSQAFWEKIPSKYLLVFQVDALLIEPIDFSMFNYDYIGAPFSFNQYLSTSFPIYKDKKENQKINKWVTQIFNKESVIPSDVVIGNGGLSIRNRDVMYEICKNESSPENENEDIYFSRLINKYSENIVPFDIAKRFSCECSYFQSIGFHASYLYLTNEQQAEIYERHMKYIFELVDLSHDTALSIAKN